MQGGKAQGSVPVPQNETGVLKPLDYLQPEHGPCKDLASQRKRLSPTVPDTPREASCAAGSLFLFTTARELFLRTAGGP
jgi:hypothetical protein